MFLPLIIPIRNFERVFERVDILFGKSMFRIVVDTQIENVWESFQISAVPQPKSNQRSFGFHRERSLT